MVLTVSQLMLCVCICMTGGADSVTTDVVS